jgi:proliferating cell nuclear antigen
LPHLLPRGAPLLSYAAAAAMSSSILDLRLVQPIHLKNLKNVLVALSDLFSKASFDFSRKGLELQDMDTTTRVAVVALVLRADAFDHYSCDRDMSMGLDLADVAAAFRFAAADDILTINAKDDFSNILTFKFESPGNI